jgi:hypothetical protein
MLAQRFTNYQQLEERLNPGAETMKHNLARLYPVPPNPPEVNSYPVVDYVFVLDLSFDKIMERVSKMRQDPTTGTIYDPVVNPAPEADKKLIARLEPVKFNQELLEQASATFDQNRHDIETYFSRFGFKELNLPVVQTLDASQTPSKLDALILDKLKHLLDFKYSLYQAEQLPFHYKTLLVDENTTENFPDVSEKIESVKHDGRNELARSSHLGVPYENTPQHRRPSVKDTVGPNTTPQNPSQNRLPKNPSYYSASKGSLRKMETLSQRSGTTRKEKLLVMSLESWDRIFNDYSENLERNLKESKDVFQIIRLHFENSQKVFASIFRERREFHTPLTSFVDGYRRFSADNPEVVKGEYCKKRLFEKIDSIHDQLWGEVEKCREKATKEKEKMITKHLINADIHSLCKIALNLIAGEMNKIYNLK